MQLDKIHLSEYSENDVSSFKETVGSCVAFYVYCPRIYKQGSITTISESLSVRPKYSSEHILVPEVLFSHLVGGRVENLTIFVGEKSLDLSQIAKAGDSHRYLDVLDAAPRLGLAVRIYGARLGIIGNESEVLAFDALVKRSPAVIHAASETVVMSMDSVTLTKEDFGEAKKKWRERIAGSPELNDLTDADIKKKIDNLSDNCQKTWETMNHGESIPKLWGDTPPVESCELRVQYGNILTLAKGYATYGSRYYHNEELARDIRFAFKWMNEHMYGDAELEGRGWRSMKDYNWWDWRVGCGELLTDAMMVTDELFTYEEKKKYLKVLEYVLDFWRVGDTQNFASGRMSLGPKTAILLEDKARVIRAMKDYHIMLEVRLAGEGTHTDYVNYQHGSPYNMMYGQHNIDRVLKSAAVLTGTALELASTRYYDLYLTFRYMFEAAMFGSRAFSFFYGRGNSGTEVSYGMKLVVGILPMIGNYGEEEDRVIKTFIKRSLDTPELVALAKKACPICFIPLLNEILADPTVSAENDFESAHAWFTADRASQHRNGYAFGLAMPSFRHPSYECINSANMQGWYTGDGALYLYKKDTPKSFDGPNFICNTNIAMRIPGTTVDMRERKRASINIGSSFRPAEDRVGCMEFDRKYVTAGMDYKCYDQPEDEIKEDKGYGGGKPKFPNDLVARKAYFMLDRECVCLGAGITSTMDSSVNTIVEHRALVKDTKEAFGTERIAVDGEEYPTDTFYKKRGKALMAEIGGVGYVFPNTESIYLSRYAFDPKDAFFDRQYLSPDHQKDLETFKNGDKPFVELRIEHGKNPQNASYVYAILPTTSGRNLARYAAKPEFTVLSNTTQCQAVRKDSIGITCIVFYEAGECAGIRVDHPAIVTYTEHDGELRIKVAEPTNKVDTLTVRIERPLTAVTHHPRFNVSCTPDAATLTLDASLSVGEGYEAAFKY